MLQVSITSCLTVALKKKWFSLKVRCVLLPLNLVCQSDNKTRLNAHIQNKSPHLPAACNYRNVCVLSHNNSNLPVVNLTQQLVALTEVTRLSEPSDGTGSVLVFSHRPAWMPSKQTNKPATKQTGPLCAAASSGLILCKFSPVSKANSSLQFSQSIKRFR